MTGECTSPDVPLNARRKGGLAFARCNGPRVLVADDTEQVRCIVSGILCGEFQIVGLAENGKEALELVVSRSPNVLVLDLFMPKLNGIETTLRVKESGLPVSVVVLTVTEDPDFLNAALAVGALGYVLKPHIATDLIPAIRTTLRGRCYISPSFHFY